MQEYFPSVVGLERTQEGNEYIYGGSIAINRILDHLRTFSDKVPYRLFMINAYTLVNNVCSMLKHASPMQINDALNNEISHLRVYIDAYGKTHNVTPIVIYYIPKYQYLPKELIRDNSKNANGIVDAIYKDVIRQYLSTPTLIDSEGYTLVEYTVPVGNHGFPHRELYSWLLKQNIPGYIPDRDRVAILTHCIVDLHISSRLGNMTLLERYTGKAIPSKDFGHKLHSSGYIPFNIYTHRVFGDKLHFKPLVSSKDRDKLVNIAKEKKWMVSTADYVLKDIVNNTKLTISDLSILKL